MPNRNSVAVVGSMTVDLTATARHLPRLGETVLGTGFSIVSGGKGSNQAVMAARMGVPTWMIGCVGGDPFRNVVLDSLHAHGVDTTFVDTVDGESTGVAHIRVDESGHNDIVIVPLANAHTSPEQVDAFFEQNQHVQVLMLQLEIPVPTVLHAAKKAKERGITVIFDPAPAVPFPDEMYRYVDIVTPNETEASVLTGVNVVDAESAEAAARVLQTKGVQTVILTLAEKGVLVLDAEGIRYYSPFQVKVLDATAAGDAFTGALGACVAEGMPLEQAIQYAMAAGALAVTKLGAQSSLPTKDEVKELMRKGESR
jgi:ribokinase